MTGNSEKSKISRRSYMKATGLAGAAGVTGLAGCLGGGNDGENTETSEGGDGTTEGSSGSQGGSNGNPLEVQHWWTGGDGGPAIKALFEGFKEQHPDVEVNQNPVSGGAGQNLQNVIKKRVLNDNPPSSWQAWPGANLEPYVEADKLNDITDSVWSENGMEDAYLQGPKDAAKAGSDNFVTVPLNIHRLNNLFYNVSVVEEAGVDPSSISKPSDLLDAMKTVDEQTDAVGMAQQTKSAWSTSQLFETVLLGEAGAETYTAFTQGNVSENQEAVKSALDTVAKYKEYFNQDAGSLTWQEANKKLINGEAAFFHQGDWAAGMYRSQGDFEFEKDWDMVAFPGTEGMYSLVMDSFAFPKNNPSPDATGKFLRYVGSVDAQERFNPKKGSIPPRTDVPSDAFGPFLQRQMEEFKNSDSQPPSIEHGLAIPPEQKSSFSEAMSSFISNWNVDNTYTQLERAFN